jgi:sugar lactone lactonase YvrE
MIRFALAVLALCLATASSPAHAWNRGHATRFATLPPGNAHPEGLTIDAAGNVWVADFDVDPGAQPGQVVEFDHSGRVLRSLNLSRTDGGAVSTLLLGLAFHPATGKLLVIDFGSHDLLAVDDLDTGASSVFTTIPGASGPNALTFDKAGNVYVSDSFQGAIWKTGPGGGAATIWSQDPLLATPGVPPFGANGIAFDAGGTAMFVANTGNDSVVKIPVQPDGTAGAPAVFVNSINGADGLAIDPDGNIWVCANQSDELVVIDPKDGHAIAKLGDFDGLFSDGAPQGLLFPASLAFRGEFVYVTNLSLDLRVFSPTFNAVDSAWAAQVTQHTVARLSRRFAPAR